MIKTSIHAIYILVGLAPLSAWPQTLTIDSPHDYQVFQRKTLDDGNVLISGSLPPDGDRLETRLAGSRNNTWQKVPVNPTTRTFRTFLPVAAGGWYSLEVRLLKGRKILAHFGARQEFPIGDRLNLPTRGT